MSTWTSRIRFLVAALAGSLMLAGNGTAAVVFTVDSIADQIDVDTADGICKTVDNTCTLRAAIMSANKAGGAGATIMLPAGIYTLILPADLADGDNNGDLNLTAPISGSPPITITGAGADVTIIDANQIDRVLSVAAGRTATISGVTFRNGFVSGGLNGGGIYLEGYGGGLTLTGCKLSTNTASGGKGGGIYTSNSLTLNQTTLSDNTADAGGGIYDALSVIASDCQLTGNKAVNGDGGGIDNVSAALILDHCTLSGNTASGSGGGIYSDESLTLSYSTVGAANSASGSGGGIFNLRTLDVDHSSISGNIATLDGGGIFNGIGDHVGTASLSQSTISGNLAHLSGGGIWNYGQLTVINSTIALNNSDLDGGGIYNIRSDIQNVYIYSSTIAYNDADHDQDFAGSGGGVFLYGAGGNGFNIYNTVLAGNTEFDQPVPDDCVSADDGGGVGPLKTHARNLFGAGNFCTIDQISGSYAALSDNSLGGLQNNGGPTKTIALLTGSNAINGTSVTGSVCNDGNSAILVDQRGFLRDDGTCDVGAFEYNDIFADGFE